MIVAMSPGKVILLGEHGVVYGKPCLTVAISLRVALNVEPGKEHTVNNQPLDQRRHSYIKLALDRLWNGKPLSMTSFSQIPSAGGLGSSAAITTACVAALLDMQGLFSKKEVAIKSFEIEYDVQNGASPNDTSACTFGGGILTWEKELPNSFLYASKGGRTWYVHKVNVTDMRIVIGNTGIKSKTPLLIKKIRKCIDHSSFGTDIINEMGGLVIEGKNALERRDFVTLGNIMNHNQKLLHTLGASSKEIDRLIQVAIKEGAYGAKLTGAGGGGSMIALTDEPERVAKAIHNKRGNAYIVSMDNEGVKVLK